MCHGFHSYVTEASRGYIPVISGLEYHFIMYSPEINRKSHENVKHPIFSHQSEPPLTRPKKGGLATSGGDLLCFGLVGAAFFSSRASLGAGELMMTS